MAKQLSIFAENARGAMFRITEAIAARGVDITALVTNDSAEYGIVRMLVSDPEAARDALAEQGYMCRLDSVLCVNITDVPGSLSALLGAISDGNVNVDYIYVSYDRAAATPIVIVHTQSEDELASMLQSRGYTLA